ncbi:unnamed protein product [Pseudo-nitzschia multistriata]|uniref:Uncharacterized protein n=1 Tax=Pseudo-nitzschia multistriata TaxID=183589 RepID=A0A448ZL59_9STRA|nr:unnamed protein product [Pseudo-nitzschia multistriata]
MPLNLSYRLFGPTTVHLRHETYLIISLALLEYASIRDLRFAAFVTVWLSRNLVVRWLLTAHDTRTSVSEWSLPFVIKYYRFQFNPLENVINFITTTVLAGQTFDRPNPHVVAKFIGTNHMLNDLMAENNLGNLNSNNPSRNNNRRGGNSSSSHHSHYYGNSSKKNHYDLVCDWCKRTFYKIKELSPSSLAVASSEAYWTNLMRSCGPSPQLVLQLFTLLFLYFCWNFPLSENGGGIVRYFTTIYTDVAQVLRDIYNIAVNRNVIYYHYGRHDDSNGPLVTNHALIMETLKDSGSAMGYSGDIAIDNTKAIGQYQHSFSPTWIDLWYYIIVCGTCLSMALYGRILLPIPDLVAGSCVLSSFRLRDGAGGKILTNVGGGGGGNKGSRNNNSQRGGGSSSIGGLATGSGGGDPNFDQPWLEQYQSIITEHRLKLILNVAFVRVVENLFLIAILPRTDFACKTTGQCPNKSGLGELAKVLFYAGITEPLRSDSQYYQNDDGKNPFSVGDNPFRPPVASALMIGISAVVITVSLLLAQAATLNRSHLGITGYLAGGWVADDQQTHPSVTDKKASKSNSRNKKSTPESLAPEWVPRKRYKKGELVTYERTVYRATTNNPEGCPYDFYLRATHKIFRNELGHPATSRVVAFVSTVQFGLISLLILMVLVHQLILGEDEPGERTTCLLWTLAANLVAVFGTVSVAVPNYSEFDRLAADLMN